MVTYLSYSYSSHPHIKVMSGTIWKTEMLYPVIYILNWPHWLNNIVLQNMYYTAFTLSLTAMKPFKKKASKTYVSYVIAFIVLHNVRMQT